MTPGGYRLEGLDLTTALTVCQGTPRFPHDVSIGYTVSYSMHCGVLCELK